MHAHTHTHTHTHTPTSFVGYARPNSSLGHARPKSSVVARLNSSEGQARPNIYMFYLLYRTYKALFSYINACSKALYTMNRIIIDSKNKA